MLKELTNQELKTICDALNAYFERQHDAASYFYTRLSSAGYDALKSELKIIEDTYDKLWGVLQERGVDDD